MSTDERSFKSDEDAQGLITQLIIEPGHATIKSIKLLNGSQEMLTLNASPISLFCVRFTKYDLDANRYSLTRDGNKQTVEYKVTSPLDCIVGGDAGKFTLKYGSVPPSQNGFSSISVTVQFTRPENSAIDGGWIDLNIAYSYPTQCVSGDKHSAWEVELIYPEICFKSTALSGYLLLDPLGKLGNFVKMASEEIINLMPLQFAAFYKAGRAANRFNYLRGVALSATDEQGHAKSLRYRPIKVGSASGRAVSFHLTTPIHLKDNAYSRPADTYTLSAGAADGGFSGAQMHYRIRAFNVLGVAENAPVDWPDVVNIYRQWLDDHQPSFYSKYISRYPNGFTQAMSPCTVIANYGLDGQIEPQATDLCKWLELHPVLVEGKADMPGNGINEGNRNESLQELLARVKERFGMQEGMKLEAQIWGFEMEGFYQGLGAYPPATDVISGEGRFLKAMTKLQEANIVPSVTTDPLVTNFNRSRFRGHLLKEGEAWSNAIAVEFPSTITAQATASNVVTTSAENNREFLALNSTDASGIGSNEDHRGSQKLDGSGQWLERFEGLTRFYNIYVRSLCPTPVVRDFYIETWLKTRTFGQGFKHVEFMKHDIGHYFCYDKNPRHEHLAGQPVFDDYDNVIGQGPWYIKRLQEIFQKVQDAGQAVAGNEFALVNEFSFPETLVPYFDEYYEYVASSVALYYRDAQSLDVRLSPVFWYVYSSKVSMKMNLSDATPYIHPGYREQKLVEGTTTAPAYMLDAMRDVDGASTSYATWRHECRLYNDTNFSISSHGIAPNAYPANTQTGENFTDYTYRHCVEEVFNLRTNIFRYGMAAVMGERIYLFSKLLEGITDYTEEIINMAVRAAHLQMKFPQFFRGGRMLGQTRLDSGNAQLWAWRAHRRQFSDIKPLVDALYTAAEVSGTTGRNPKPPVPLSIMDFISRGVDKLHIVPHGNFDYVPKQEPDILPMASRVTADRIQHMVWQSPKDAPVTTLYTFANVGNSSQTVNFLYGRGLESAASWKRTDYTFAGDPSGSPVLLGTIAFKQQGSVVIAPRTCIGILFEL
jgi:hypothetical protein